MFVYVCMYVCIVLKWDFGVDWVFTYFTYFTYLFSNILSCRIRSFVHAEGRKEGRRKAI